MNIVLPTLFERENNISTYCCMPCAGVNAIVTQLSIRDDSNGQLFPFLINQIAPRGTEAGPGPRGGGGDIL
jgi:hypothetical protein